MKNLTLTIIVTYLLIGSANVFALQITPPEPVIFSCPTVPNDFKIGGVYITDYPFAIWGLDSNTPQLPVGSTVTTNKANGDLPVTFSNGAVYASVFGKTLNCYGSFKNDKVTYSVIAATQVTYNNCTYVGNNKFRCTNPR